MFQELKKKIDFEISSIQFVKRDGIKYLDIEIPETDLQKIEHKSRIISNILDEIYLTDQNYYLNIYSTGTEKEIKIDNLNLFLNSYLFFELKKQILDKNKWEGTLIENNNDHVVLKINKKGRFQKITILKENIVFVKTTTRLRKEAKYEK
ncbi:MAG: hypothetical protein IKJ03_02900 [Mycoplasmataceae bacterium]|nr:hypothetical protein [Mycoplasmataceae bacterium]